VALLAFSSGIPLSLTGTTLQAWMKTENVDLKLIGLFSLVGLPYTLKFLWAPVMDRFSVPLLGRRRGWIVLTQLGLMLTTAGMAFIGPAQHPGLTAAVAFFVAFLSASQDIVIDAHRTDMLAPEERGPGASIYLVGYRVAMLVSGALTLIMADHMSWRSVYLLMAATLLAGVAGTLVAPEPQVDAPPPRSLRDAVVQPFLEFFRRKGAHEIIGFVILYKMDAVVAMALMTPFMMDLGFTMTEIGAVSKGFGLASMLLGSALGGILMIRLGTKRSLWAFGIFQALSGLSFWLLARYGHSYSLMVASIVLENFSSGMGSAAFFAFLMALCDRRFSATQYALLSSLMALTRVLGAAPTGYFQKAVGWENYYLLSRLLAVPGLLLLLRYDRWMQLKQEREGGVGATS
jgi:MFS transporter, PAT family, beta-lactamase induction signal transducer AmpG